MESDINCEFKDVKRKITMNIFQDSLKLELSCELFPELSDMPRSQMHDRFSKKGVSSISDTGTEQKNKAER